MAFPPKVLLMLEAAVWAGDAGSVCQRDGGRDGGGGSSCHRPLLRRWKTLRTMQLFQSQFNLDYCCCSVKHVIRRGGDLFAQSDFIIAHPQTAKVGDSVFACVFVSVCYQNTS